MTSKIGFAIYNLLYGLGKYSENLWDLIALPVKWIYFINNILSILLWINVFC